MKKINVLEAKQPALTPRKRVAAYARVSMDTERLKHVYEEETEKAIRENGPEAAEWEETHSFTIPDGAHWDDVRNVPTDVGKAIQTAFRAIEKANSDKLTGIFGDGTWTNKRRLPDRLLKDLLEHFSSKTLSIENCPEDELGYGYEYLIKKFADDSGHTAQEFYTNRTVVHLIPSTAERPSSPERFAAGAAAGGTAQRSGTATTSTAGWSGSAIPSSKTRPAAEHRT